MQKRLYIQVLEMFTMLWKICFPWFQIINYNYSINNITTKMGYIISYYFILFIYNYNYFNTFLIYLSRLFLCFETRPSTI